MKDAVSRYLAERKILDESYGMLEAICTVRIAHLKRIPLFRKACT